VRALPLRVVDVSQIAELVAAGEDAAGLVAITFDDALAGVARVGLPVLQEAGISATIYVPADHLGEPPAFWPGAERTMTPDELRTAVSNGHSLGSHTATHRSLVTLAEGEVEDELRRSKGVLEELSDRPVQTMAYPSGHHDDAVRSRVRHAGYTSACTFLNGRATSDVDPFRLPRFTMGAHSSSLRFFSHLARPARSWPNHQVSEVGFSPAK
jgi:peptidoglycan/xylan/chitin deacetylase (PgdA/CDA1 family)